MSKEEIIDKIYKLRNVLTILNDYGKEDVEAIDGLLDLYEKEKEKNKELEQLSENIKMFREKNLSSEIDYVIALKSNFMEYLKEDYISKDKINEKIEILEKLQKEFLNNEEIRIKIIALKELIGGITNE